MRWTSAGHPKADGGTSKDSSCFASQGNTTSENLWLSVTRVKNAKALLGPSPPEISVDLAVGVKSDPLG